MIVLGVVLVVVGLVAVLFYNGYRETPPTPPFKVNKMFLGRYSRSNGGRIKLISGGNRFFLLYPWVQEPAVFNFSDQNFPEVQVDEVRTPDAVDLDFFYEVTWFVNPDYLEEFLETSGATKSIEQAHFDKVQRILAGVIAETVREYASSEARGPKTWQQAVAMKPEAAEEIIRRICEREDHGELTPEDINRVRAGNGSSKMVAKGMGISIKRLNVTKVVPDKGVELAAEEKEEERRRIMAEELQIDFLAESTAKLAEKASISGQEAIYAIQTERGKATRQIFTLDQSSTGTPPSGGQTPPVIVVQAAPTPTAPRGKREGGE